MNSDNGFAGPPPRPGTLDIVQSATDMRSLLVVIAGCVDSMRTVLPRDVASEELLFDLDRALDGSFRLTHDMLTLARRTGDIGIVDLHDLVIQNLVLLERMVGPDVALFLNLAASTAIVHGDAVQLEWALLGVVLNSRDAMAHRGTLTISTTVLDPTERVWEVPARRRQRYVRLTISDTGPGMDARCRRGPSSRSFPPGPGPRAPGSPASR